MNTVISCQTAAMEMDKKVQETKTANKVSGREQSLYTCAMKC